MMTPEEREAYVQALAWHRNQAGFLWQLLYGDRAETRRRINNAWDQPPYIPAPMPVDPDDKGGMMMHD